MKKSNLMRTSFFFTVFLSFFTMMGLFDLTIAQPSGSLTRHETAAESTPNATSPYKKLHQSLTGPALNPERKPVTVFFRIDDIFMLESDYLPQEVDSFLTVADRFGARVMLATMPNRLNQVTNRDGAMARQLREFHQRGHQVLQHGFDHRCRFTQSTSWEFHNPAVENGYTGEQITNQVREGKLLLERAIGSEVTTYVGPGFDNGVVYSEHSELYYEAGFTVLTDQSTSEMYREGDYGFFFSVRDHAWALNPTNFEGQLAEAKASFEQAIAEGDQWGILFHDHFTRYAWGEGITIRWFETLLQWLVDHPVAQVHFMSIDEWMDVN
jgi:hypothetical protein